MLEFLVRSDARAMEWQSARVREWQSARGKEWQSVMEWKGAGEEQQRGWSMTWRRQE